MNKFEFLNVIDLESTCWETKNPPEGELREIIEIGIAVLRVNDLVVVNSESILLKPQTSKVSEYCTKLTTLTQEQLDRDGILFDQACSILHGKFATAKLPWASWGNFDRRMFDTQLSYSRWKDTRYPFGRVSHFNVKDLFSLRFKLSKGLGMAAALEMLQIPLEGTHHRGIDDAKNIAKIVGIILK